MCVERFAFCYRRARGGAEFQLEKDTTREKRSKENRRKRIRSGTKRQDRAHVSPALPRSLLHQRVLPQKEQRDQLQKAVRRELECETWGEKKMRGWPALCLLCCPGQCPEKTEQALALSLCLVCMLANCSSVHPVFFLFTRVVCVRACWWGIEQLIDSLCTVSSQHRPTGVARSRAKVQKLQLLPLALHMGTVIAQMFTCIHVLREDRLCECSHVVTIREKSQSRAAGRALTRWAGAQRCDEFSPLVKRFSTEALPVMLGCVC